YNRAAQLAGVLYRGKRFVDGYCRRHRISSLGRMFCFILHQLSRARIKRRRRRSRRKDGPRFASVARSSAAIPCPRFRRSAYWGSPELVDTFAKLRRERIGVEWAKDVVILRMSSSEKRWPYW